MTISNSVAPVYRIYFSPFYAQKNMIHKYTTKSRRAVLLSAIIPTAFGKRTA